MKLEHIRAIGFEVEGGWKKDRVIREDSENYRKGFHSDGSVSNIRASFPVWAGEYASEPLLNYENLIETMEEEWPDMWNSSCGMHVHISTQSMQKYSTLMDQVFYRAFKKEISKVLIPSITDMNTQQIFADRLAGHNTYCKTGWRSDAQAQQNDKGSLRYHHLNFCWKLHGTMEVRVPPMMSLNDGKTTMKWIVEFTEKYLNKKKKEKIFKTEIEETPLERQEALLQTTITKEDY